MDFEYDNINSQKNKERHGIDFDQAKALWDDPDLLEIPARTEDEPRCLVTGRIEKRFWSGVITYRNSRIGIISVRRSGDEEVTLYEG